MAALELVQFKTEDINFSASIVGCEFTEEGLFCRDHVGIAATLELPVAYVDAACEIYQELRHPKHVFPRPPTPLMHPVEEDSQRVQINIGEPIHVPSRRAHAKEVQVKLDFYDTFIARVAALVRS